MLPKSLGAGGGQLPFALVGGSVPPATEVVTAVELEGFFWPEAGGAFWWCGLVWFGFPKRE